MKKFFKDFKAFISRGNVVDMAVGVIIGTAFSAIVTALTNKIIMPFINLLLSLGGENGLEAAVTILKPAYKDGVLDLASSIYIDWGAFITAIINFFLIALVLFLILKAMMATKGISNKLIKEYPTRAERKELKAMGIETNDRKVLIAETKKLRESKIPAPQPPKPTTEELLAQILTELQKQNEKEEPKKTSKSKKTRRDELN